MKNKNNTTHVKTYQLGLRMEHQNGMMVAVNMMIIVYLLSCFGKVKQQSWVESRFFDE